MPEGVTGLFGGVNASAPSYAGAASRSSLDSGDPSASFDDVLDRAYSGSSGSAEYATDSPKTWGASTAAPSKKTASSHASAKKRSSATDAAQTKPAKTTKKDRAAEAEQNASPDAGSQETEAVPNGRDGSAKRAKPEKKPDPAAGPADSPAATAQLQNAPAPKQGTDAKATANQSAPASDPQPSTSSDPASAQPATADAAAQQPTGDLTAPSDGQTDPATSPDASVPQGKVRLAIQPKDGTSQGELDPTQATTAAAAAAMQQGAGQVAAADLTATDVPTAPDAVASTTGAPPAPRTSAKSPDDLVLQAFGGAPQTSHPAAADATPNTGTTTDATPTSSPAQFAQANHSNIVSGIAGRLLPGGGSMQIRLDPPELGAMRVRVEMRDGVMTASFETSTDQATKLLSHSLGDLKAALEAQGVSVERLHVSQTSKQQESSSGSGQKGDSQTRQDTAAQQEQQRREMMQRMWRRLMKGQDPLDLVA